MIRGCRWILLRLILGDKFGLLGVGDDNVAKADILPKLEGFLNRTSDYEGLKPANGSKVSKKVHHLFT